MNPIKEYFINYTIINPPLKVSFCDDQVYEAIGKGTIQINLSNGQTTTIYDVLHIPALAKSLISVYKATLQCQSIEFFHNYAIRKYKNSNDESIEMHFNQIDNLYPFANNALIKNSNSMAITKPSNYDTMKWHH